MRFRISNFTLNGAAFVALLLLLKSMYLIGKLSCKMQRKTYIYERRQLNNEATSQEVHITVQRSKIDEENSWANYQRDIISKQQEVDRKQHFNTDLEETTTVSELNKTFKIKHSIPKSKVLQRFWEEKQEESDEFNSDVLKDETKSRESAGEILRESVRFATKENKHDTSKRFVEEYEHGNNYFIDKLKKKEVKEKEKRPQKGNKIKNEEVKYIEKQKEPGMKRVEGEEEGKEIYPSFKHEKENGDKEKQGNKNVQNYNKIETPPTAVITKSISNNSSKQRLRLKTNRKSHFLVKKKVVLLYTSLFDRIPWPDLENSDNFTQFRGKPCAVRNCEITYDKSRILESDAVLFHCRDLPSSEEMKRIPRHEKQRWVFFTHENPVFTYKNLTLYNHFFNWTMTYRSDSDFFVPYNYYSPLNSDDYKAKKWRKNNRVKHKELMIKSYAEGKDKFVAWMVGNCGQLRDEVVSKLAKYVNVTIFGACARKFNQSGNRCAHGSRDCKKLLQRFKFYLSFENQICLDYVTEKYWYTPFEHDMVPLVLGSNYNTKVAVPGSFINVLDFSSVKSLAQYLQYLDRNDTAYNEYFDWKTKYKIDYPLSVVWTCNLCAALNNDSMPSKIYHDLDLFWGAESTCGRNRDEIDALIKDS